MSTGYTAAIAKGITFREYALRCAHAFGALVHMRDESSDAPIPNTIQPSNYHSKQLEVARQELKRLQKMTIKECKEAARADHDKRFQEYLTNIKEEASLKTKYELMLKQVEQYTPPSSEHDHFKEFMRSQIKDSMGFDCHGLYENYIRELKRQTPQEWKRLRLTLRQKDISYHVKEQRKENARAFGRTRWIRQLLKSLE